MSVEVNVLWCQSQQFANTQARVVHDHENGVTDRSVLHGFNEHLEFFVRPEQHFIGVLLTHGTCLVTGVLPQSVELHRKIEGCDKLVVDGSQISWCITSAVGLAEVNQFILPVANIGRFDGTERHLTEVREDFLIEQVALVGISSFSGTRNRILHIDFNEILEFHAQATICLTNKITFPLQGFFLSIEASFLFVDLLSCPILYSDLGHPLACVFVSCY